MVLKSSVSTSLRRGAQLGAALSLSVLPPAQADETVSTGGAKNGQEPAWKVPPRHHIDSALPETSLTENLAFQEMTSSQQLLAKRIFEVLPAQAQSSFLQLCEREAKGEGKVAILSMDFKGESMLDTLGKFCFLDFHPRLEPLREKILVSSLLELAHPEQLNQGSWGVCGTAMIYGLYDRYPAEGARILLGLLRPEGSVSLLKPGEVLYRAPYALVSDQEGTRSTSERVLLSSLMHYAVSPEKTYCKICDVNFDNDTGEIGKGLTSQEQLRLFQGVYNLSSADAILIERKNGFEDFEPYLEKYLPGLLSAGVRWSKKDRERLADDLVHRKDAPRFSREGHFEREDERSLRVKLKDFELHHRVELLDIVGEGESRRVLYRSLWGVSKQAAGTVRENPPRRCEDPERGIWSMPFKAFQDRLSKIMIPYRWDTFPKPKIPGAESEPFVLSTLSLVSGEFESIVLNVEGNSSGSLSE